MASVESRLLTLLGKAEMASERPEVAAFFRAIHEVVFKPRGYTKERRTFRKREEGYSVGFRFQGSRWNDSASPWRFYLNVGVRFDGIPRREQDKDFPETHSWSRICPGLSSWAEAHFDIDSENDQRLIGLMAAIVVDCQNYFSVNHQLLRARYEAQRLPFLGYLDEALMKRA